MYAKRYRTQAIARVGERGSAGSKAYWGDNYKAANAAQRRRRELMRYKGDGDYKDYLRWGARGLGALAGGALGAYAGGLGAGVSGARRGWDVGAQVSKFAGWGDYGPVVTNDLMMPASQRAVAVNASNASGDIYFQHSEFIRNISLTAEAAGTTPFTLQSFALNPGLETTFPFLSQIAANFTLYEFQGLIFQYKPTSGEFGAAGSNSLGKIIMCTNYDPSSYEFTNSQQMENYDHASACKPSIGMHHGVETAPSQRSLKQMYVRTDHSQPGPAPPGQKDKELTDLGLFQIATEGIYASGPGTQVIGELWVTYVCKLSRANLNATQAGALINQDLFRAFLPSSGFGSPKVLFEEANAGFHNSIGCSIDPGGANWTSQFDIAATPTGGGTWGEPAACSYLSLPGPDTDWVPFRIRFPTAVLSGLYLIELRWHDVSIVGTIDVEDVVRTCEVSAITGHDVYVGGVDEFTQGLKKQDRLQQGAAAIFACGSHATLPTYYNSSVAVHDIAKDCGAGAGQTWTPVCSFYCFVDSPGSDTEADVVVFLRGALGARPLDSQLGISIIQVDSALALDNGSGQSYLIE